VQSSSPPIVLGLLLTIMIRVSGSDTNIELEALPGRNVDVMRLDPLSSAIAVLIVRHCVLKDLG
jgi:hypothetical protein